MFQHRELGLIQAYQVGASVVMTILFWIYYLALSTLIPNFTLTGFSNYFEYYLAMMLAFQLSFLSGKHTDILSVSSGIVESHRFVWPHVVFAGAITCMFLVLTGKDAISRLFLFPYLPLSYFVLVIFSRYFALDILRFFLRHQRQKMLLIGQPGELGNVKSLLSKAKLFGFEITGMVTEAPQEEIPDGIRRLGGPDELEAVLDREPEVGNIFVLGSPRDRRVLGGWMRFAETRGCRVSLVNDLDVFLQRRLSYFRCDDIDLIELREEPLQNLVHRFIKRAFDIALSLPVVLFVLPPLMIVVWILQRIQAPGPLIFIQKRSGTDNRPFMIFKFRTMYANRVDSGAQATRKDSRVYPAGALLRRLSLDEFPQFFNVLIGNMSLVGPRPHMTQHDEIFAQTMSVYRVRAFVKPGITGLAQINGCRGEASQPEDVVKRVEYDIEYIEKWSFLLDLRIIWYTALQVLRPPKSAY